MPSFPLLLLTISLTAPPGVVPAELLRFETVAPGKGILDRAATCEESIASEQAVEPVCKPAAPMVAAVDHGKGRLAALFAGSVPSCECGEIALRTMDARGRPSPPEPLLKAGWCDEQESWRLQLDAWRAVGKLLHKGFLPAPSLVAGRVSVKGGIRDASPVVRLGEPLAGWMLHVAPEDPGHGGARPGRGKLLVRLVDPANSRGEVLGKLPMTEGACSALVSAGDGGVRCSEHALRRFAFVEDVVLLGKNRIAVALRLMDGTNCGVDDAHVLVYEVPKR